MRIFGMVLVIVGIAMAILDAAYSRLIAEINRNPVVAFEAPSALGGLLLAGFGLLLVAIRRPKPISRPELTSPASLRALGMVFLATGAAMVLIATLMSQGERPGASPTSLGALTFGLTVGFLPILVGAILLGLGRQSRR